MIKYIKNSNIFLKTAAIFVHVGFYLNVFVFFVVTPAPLLVNLTLLHWA